MVCEICGKEIEKSKYSNGIICSSECFDEHFWLSVIREFIDMPETFAIIDGWCYRIEDENVAECCKGFYGNKHIIKYNDGKTITTTNLWTNGEIPNKYRIVLKNNAEFVVGQ